MLSSELEMVSRNDREHEATNRHRRSLKRLNRRAAEAALLPHVEGTVAGERLLLAFE